MIFKKVGIGWSLSCNKPNVIWLQARKEYGCHESKLDCSGIGGIMQKRMFYIGLLEITRLRSGLVIIKSWDRFCWWSCHQMDFQNTWTLLFFVHTNSDHFDRWMVCRMVSQIRANQKNDLCDFRTCLPCGSTVNSFSCNHGNRLCWRSVVGRE